MQKPEQCILVIFGASGDLTSRKLLPALYRLSCAGFMPERFAILGVSRTSLSDQEFRAKITDSLSQFMKSDSADSNTLSAFLASCFYLAVDSTKSENFQKIKQKTEELAVSLELKKNIIFYLSVAPTLYETIACNIAKAQLQQEEQGYRRIIVEKPFGRDLASALELNQHLQEVFQEKQIYRIDHYLGKETVQNILALRFANGIFEPLWNRNYIDHIEITAAEQLGVGSRAEYYEQTGALRDMVQNHLLQVLGTVAMEEPVKFEPTSVRNEMLKVFQALSPLKGNEFSSAVIKGQYTAATIAGQKVRAYRCENGVSKMSNTETYIALRILINNGRWGGVPFYVRTGKHLPTRVTEVVVNFKQTPHQLFKQNDSKHSQANQLIIRIQPDEGILLRFGMKIPGLDFKIQSVDMNFHYKDLTQQHLPEAYERLLLDCMHGDATLYARSDVVEACWTFIDPILAYWQDNPQTTIYGYPAGTWGPSESHSIFIGDKKEWRYPCKNLSSDGTYCEL